jgi:hypothetical protein
MSRAKKRASQGKLIKVRVPVVLLSACQNPCSQCFGVSIAQLWLSGHWDGAPFTAAASFDAFGQSGFYIGLASVFLGDVLVGWANNLFVSSMASQAVVFLSQIGVSPSASASERQKGDGCQFLHLESSEITNSVVAYV